MYRDITFARGVILACVAAGPVFLTSTVLFAMIESPLPVAIDASTWMIVAFTIPSIIVGGLFALLPNLIGTAVLARVANGNIGLRLPAVWGLIGGLIAGCTAAALGGDDAVTAPLAVTGALSALLCRWGTHWPD